MRGRALWAAAIACLLPCTCLAQDGLRTASLPERDLVSTVPADRDLFRVEPDFYSRPIDRRPTLLFFPYYVPAPYWYVPPSVHTRPTAGRDVTRRRAGRKDPPYRDTPAPNVTLPPVAPGVPKTFYVIPGCYAGDIPPLPEWLPRGCDLSRVRIVPPR